MRCQWLGAVRCLALCSFLTQYCYYGFNNNYRDLSGHCLHTMYLNNFSSSTSASAEASNAMTSRPDSVPPILFSEASKFHTRNDGLSMRRRWLVVDFDGTCTQHDTTPLLPKLASYVARSRSTISSDENKPKDTLEEFNHEHDLQRRLTLFEQLENEFLTRYNAVKTTLLSREAATDMHVDNRMQSLHEVLDALDEPSTIVTGMVSESGVLHGLGCADSTDLARILNLKGATISTNENDSDNVAEKGKWNTTQNKQPEDKIDVQLRPGCKETLARILLSHSFSDPELISKSSCLGWSLGILSINWCPALIDASLVQPILREKRRILNQQHCETEVPIWSNEVTEEGFITLQIPGALAKRDRILELKNCLEYTQDDTEAPGEHLIVYVGDSSTDLAALIEADIGVIMGTSSSTRAVAEKYGIHIQSLKNRHEYGFGIRSSSDNTLWQTESWQEISEMLDEIDTRWNT